MASGLKSPLSVGGIILVIFGIILSVIGIIFLVVYGSNFQWWPLVTIIAGLLMFIGGGIMLTVGLKKKYKKQMKDFPLKQTTEVKSSQLLTPLFIFGILFLIGGGIALVIGVILLIIYSSNFQWWTLLLTIVGLLITLAGGIMLAIDLRKKPKKTDFPQEGVEMQPMTTPYVQRSTSQQYIPTTQSQYYHPTATTTTNPYSTHLQPTSQTNYNQQRQYQYAPYTHGKNYNPKWFD